MAAKKKASKKKAKLNPKQLRFAAEYPIDCNGTQAAIRAGYSEKTARAQGARLLTNADIKKIIEKSLVKANEKAGLTVETVLANIENLRKRANKDDDRKHELRAMDMQARHVSLYNDKIDLNENKTVTLIIGGLEDDE